jgi:hypothetical protein
MGRCCVVIPWRAGGLERADALQWVLSRYEAEHPDWTVLVAEQEGGGPWCKAAAVMPVVGGLDADTLVVVADADVWCDHIDEAVAQVELGAVGWAVPHTMVHRLNANATIRLHAGERVDLQEPGNHDQRPYRGVLGGGIVALPRDTLLDVPLDPRFVGWGQEDLAWAVALHTLHGPAWRGSAPLVHCWHPHPERLNRRIGNPAGKALYRRYLNARLDPAGMRALLDEVVTDVVDCAA